MKRRVYSSKVAEYFLDEEYYNPTQEEVDNYEGVEFNQDDPDDYAILDEETNAHLDGGPKNHSIYGLRSVSDKKTQFFYVGENGLVYETFIVHPTNSREYPAHFIPNKALRYTWEDAKFKLLTLKNMSKERDNPYFGVKWFITHNN